MKLTGGCHCGAVRYEIQGAPFTHALCHCSDCRKHSGAPVVAWCMVKADTVKVTQGEPKTYESSKHGRRSFCSECGTGLFYTNAHTLAGVVDVQSATLDQVEALQPKAQIQVAERLEWFTKLQDLPEFERYPPV